MLEDAVAAQDFDLAPRTVDVPQRHHNVPSSPMFHEKIALVVRHDHPLARHSHPDPSLLADQTVIFSGNPSGGWSDYRD